MFGHNLAIPIPETKAERETFLSRIYPYKRTFSLSPLPPLPPSSVSQSHKNLTPVTRPPTNFSPPSCIQREEGSPSGGAVVLVHTFHFQ